MFREIRPLLWRWELPHPEWTPAEAADGGWEQVVASYGLVSDGELLLIDPLAPPDGNTDAEQFWAALDGEVHAHGPPSVLLTIFWHARSAKAVLDRYPGASVWAYEPARDLVAERTRVTHAFSAGESLPGGAVALDADRVYEAMLWLPSHGALVAGDVLLGAPGGQARLCPASWLPDGGSLDGVRHAVAKALDLPLELLLLTHGEVVEDDPAGVLRRAIDGAGG